MENIPTDVNITSSKGSMGTVLGKELEFACKRDGFGIDGSNSTQCELSTPFEDIPINQQITVLSCPESNIRIGCPTNSKLTILRALYGYELKQIGNCKQQGNFQNGNKWPVS